VLAACLFAVPALALAGPALASEEHPTLPELEGEVMCLVCATTLDQSHSAFAERERALIRRLIAAGLTKSQIKDRLVAEYGEQVLAEPPKHGFNLLAWVLPIAGVILAAVVLGWLAWRWSRGRRGPPDDAPGPPLDPELERQVDRELARFDA
jgi:cytochrome c-type biogenesis protein CcmH